MSDGERESVQEQQPSHDELHSPLFTYYAVPDDPSFAQYAAMVLMLERLGYMWTSHVERARLVFPPWSAAREMALSPDTTLASYGQLDVLPNEIELLDLEHFNSMLRRYHSPYAIELFVRHMPGAARGRFLQRPAFGGIESPSTRVLSNPAEWYNPTCVLLPLPSSAFRVRGMLAVFRGMVLVRGDGVAFLSNHVELLLMDERAPSMTAPVVMDASRVGIADARTLLVDPIENTLRCFLRSCADRAQTERFRGRQHRLLQADVIAFVRGESGKAGKERERPSLVPFSVDYHVLRVPPVRQLDQLSRVHRIQLQEMIGCMLTPDIGREMQLETSLL